MDARVKMGDYWFYGVGTGHRKADGKTSAETNVDGGASLVAGDSDIGGLVQKALKWVKIRARPPTSGDPDYAKAATFYQVAAEMEYSAVAMWNLGWMHECGIGVEQVRILNTCTDRPILLALMVASVTPSGFQPGKTSVRPSTHHKSRRIHPCQAIPSETSTKMDLGLRHRSNVI